MKKLTILFGLGILLLSSCKKDPYLNPDFKPGRDQGNHVFYVKAQMKGSSNFNREVGDSLIAGRYDEVVSASNYRESATYEVYSCKFIPPGGPDETYYYLHINLAVPAHDKDNLLSYLQKNKEFRYAVGNLLEGGVELSFAPNAWLDIPSARYYSHLIPGSINNNSYFNITEAEAYEDPLHPGEKQIKFKARFSCYTTDNQGKDTVQLTGETVGMF